MALAAAAASLDDKAFWAFLQIDSLPCSNSFVVIDFKLPCRFTVAQLFFHHGFHDQLLEFRRISLVFRMTSNELKHQAKMQEWGLAIQDCRSSGLSVREWCRQRGVTPATYYRWEREVLSGIRRKDGVERSGTAFVELPAPQLLRNVSERTATLNIGSGSIDLYQEINPELLRTLVELLRTC